MYKNPKIKLWRFPVQNNRSRFEDGGRCFFEVRSTEKALELGFRIEAVKRIKLQRLRNNAWMLNGIVVLDDQKSVAKVSNESPAPNEVVNSSPSMRSVH